MGSFVDWASLILYAVCTVLAVYGNYRALSSKLESSLTGLSKEVAQLRLEIHNAEKRATSSAQEAHLRLDRHLESHK